MLKKGNKLNSILTGSCPRCQRESMYVDPNPLHLQNVLKMKDHCGHCGLKYMIEPSFFYGAMYVSYGVNVAIAILVFVATFFMGLPPLSSFLAIVIVLLLLFPFVLRLSRNIYINIFVSYDKDGGE